MPQLAYKLILTAAITGVAALLYYLTWTNEFDWWAKIKQSGRETLGAKEDPDPVAQEVQAMRAELRAWTEKNQTPDRQAELTKKYPQGWALFGIGNAGEVYTLDTQFRSNYRVDLHQVKLVENAEILTIHLPSVTKIDTEGKMIAAGISRPAGEKVGSAHVNFVKDGLSGAILSGKRQLGPMPFLVTVDELALGIEVLSIESNRIVFVLGFTRPPYMDTILMAEAVFLAADDFRKLYNEQQFEQIMSKYGTPFTDEESRLFVAAMKKSFEARGPIVRTRKTNDLTHSVRKDLFGITRSVEFAKGQKLDEILMFNYVGGKVLLYDFRQVRKLTPETLNPKRNPQ